MFKKCLLVVSALFAISLSAHADEFFVGAREFSEMIEQYKVACAEKCQKPFYQTVLHKDEHTHRTLSDGQYRALLKIAKRQAYEWADTILEGDYYADGNTSLDQIVGIFKGHKLVAYKIYYSERAWETAECDFDGSDITALESCKEGIIKETTFVSPDFKTFIRNHDDIADFHTK